MITRSFSYWFVCGVIAILAVEVAEAGMEPSFTLPAEAASSVLPVPEPGRAILLFAGIMAMAFTYRRAWLGWKRGSQS
ncbi:MAG: PEP-CTERM sorting domain-containing protein [Prosthecobacter sp.]|nr:PEP-CTERM sorting domain-containing protein [Prosthecobacter sp.]